jgi:hypothetical protein
LATTKEVKLEIDDVAVWIKGLGAVGGWFNRKDIV